MERSSVWNSYDESQEAELASLARRYMDFLSHAKTERLCVREAVSMAEAAGYRRLEDLIAAGAPLAAGDKVYAELYGKTLILANIGTRPLEEGFNILGAHVDSPRLDVKQNPLYESSELAFLDTHYYGGIKQYQWVALPLALYGVIARKDGSVIDVACGDGPDDPVFCITDLLPHLAKDQMKKSAAEAVASEDLDLLVGSRPLPKRADEEERQDAFEDADAPEAEKEEKTPVKAHVLKLLAEFYGVEEEDFLSAELEIVPAGAARDCGFDRSLVLGYGQDDRVCAFTSLAAQLAVDEVERTSLCILVDKEEIGSVGATGMSSAFFENTVAELMALAGCAGDLALRRALARSSMLSSDVSAAFDPSYGAVFETKNSAYCGHGVVFNKYTGARGKSGSNDANAEYIARIRRVMDEAGVTYQTAELGKVDVGGGGTIAYLPAKYAMNVIDCGVPVLSMHAPWEVTSKADLYEAYRCYKAFLSSF